ncbi:exodeoxyribonuclease III [Tsukamurella tyrosinosolvens]|uniref:exodeoxyribonuclease III n=1 Tax=Tsukamurella tyrosinosolvens TaxID=57704 RepID=UPI00079BC268|nr:exodeoxyribonuclease III [Tsukamurella tyrosinosolvens]AUN39022.1 exodeoxyribonuclease III [Tsukamurella tyrosinosolvens]KXP02280.1 exodeoxyribonuclease III [Tsukamurella tyrosinosolvens]KZL96418.1 exodeoxyribonuclease III [Tsukamurella tyrosinosolvens]MCA4996294.1 exodeoxyribonuclease III [Tsukamurella tyrosinosolvens]WEL93682.1 exodeoxyribonuclease III [Tsukamurella tyrosinosolvens]
MRVATWNVNSVKQRHGRLLEWLDSRRPDVVCLQELKLTDDAFATLIGPDLEERGYEFATAGQPQWNGSALLSKVGLEDVVVGIPGAPAFDGIVEGRAISGVCDGIRVHSLYTPNGREIGSDHYDYKLEWLAALAAQVKADTVPQLVCGDMNIAPTDADVFDPAAFVGHTHVTAPERGALTALADLGLRDVVREHWPDEQVFSYWDYRAGMFNKNLGMRIDLILASGDVADRTAAAWIDRQARKGKGPSDHAPVMLDLDTAPDGDVGPMVPPPSAGRVSPKGAKLPQAKD